MSYDSIEATSAEGRPFFLYQFAQDAQVWRFTSRASDWIDPSDVLWQAAAISHGNVVQTSEIERGALEVTFPLSHPSVFVKQVVRRFHAASLVSGALASRSGLSQTGPTGCQLRVLPDQRSGFCARALA